jgi:hypothetical protein
MSENGVWKRIYIPDCTIYMSQQIVSTLEPIFGLKLEETPCFPSTVTFNHPASYAFLLAIFAKVGGTPVMDL